MLNSICNCSCTRGSAVALSSWQASAGSILAGIDKHCLCAWPVSSSNADHVRGAGEHMLLNMDGWDAS